MHGNLEELIIPIVIFPSIVIIFKSFFDYLTRKRLIEKGIVGDEAKKMFQYTIERYVPTSLKWGLVLVLVGITTVVLKMIPDVEGEVAFGVILIAAGAGLLIYYYIASQKAKAEQSKM